MLFFDRKNALHTSEESQPLLGNIARGTSNCILDLTGTVNVGFSLTHSLTRLFGSHSLQALSLSSCLIIPISALSIHDGLKKIRLSERIQDWTGRVLGYLQLFRGGLRCIAGALFLPALVATAVHLLTSIKTNSVFFHTLREAGGTLLAAASFLLSISACIFIAKAFEFRKHIQEVVQEPNGSHKALLELQGEISRGNGAYITYATNPDCVEGIKEASPLDAEAKIEEVLRENVKKILFSSLLLFLSLGSVAITAVSVLTPGLSFALAIIDTIFASIWLFLDAHGFVESASSKDASGKYDHIWMKFTFIFSTLLVIGSAILTGGTIPFAITIVMGIIFLAMHTIFFKQ